MLLRIIAARIATTGELADVAAALMVLSVAFGAIGVGMSALLLIRRQLLESSQRFAWFAELGLVFLFELSLPVTVAVIQR